MGEARRPNLLVTGTPGTGKTSFSSLLAEATGLAHINVGDLIKEKKLYDGWDEILECHILDEDLLLDELEARMAEGGKIVDYHCCSFFPESWFDAVVVLQTNNSVLYDRLTSRGYSGKKLENNLECEIFQVLLEEARESYSPDIIRAMPSDTIQDMNNNVEIVQQWLQARTPSL
ncbi:hypothetical protein SELMODRAFT_86651 [Selaginella moellendorffii]|uniref:Adenylate kinase isoenzyme 6 homolog n=1 Tax=Selaginella moellendorffii TaxID=88036 RepID=D8R6W7_SELML|nr:adenylate kinase isoenzyme 6 homolog [Selaginella moellendorffii]EFJ31415.1 hypothetical protein SELMODRAFT_86651 [Selaginella moellendorffii]|eukprot:XP_002966816.1 adenylate kinase isoenzyme 6 homolog [Selaginella moellendorffii]